MLSLSQLLGFLPLALAITMSPGPDNLMVLGLGMSQGRRQGMAFGVGCALGCLSHTALAVLGISALIAASPMAFTALRIGGGAYLIWLGIQALRSRGARGPAAQQTPTGARRLFVRGLIANAINPKVVLFFLSFLPQFVVPAHGHVPLQLALLGLSFTAQALLLFGLLGWFAGTIGQWLQRWPRAGLWLDRLAGAIFCGLGARLLALR